MMTAALDARRARPVKFTQAGLETLNPLAEIEQEPNMPAGHLAGMFNAQGPNANCLTACAASSQAIGEATEIIRRGDADVMLSGGAHSMIHPFGVTGFNLLTALSDQQRRADQGLAARSTASATALCWAKGRRWWCWKSWSTPRSAAAKIYGEIIGYGTTADAYRITDIHPEGRGAISLHEDGHRRRRPEPDRTFTTSTPTAPAPR